MIKSISKEVSLAREKDSGLTAIDLLRRYDSVRRRTEWICEPLAVEDCVVQTSVECSPVKWQLGHTTWFFETFVLKPFVAQYREYHEKYSYLFNSYYNAIGDRVARPERGMMSRPTMQEVGSYRQAIDEAITRLLKTANEETLRRIAPVLILGTHHEEQHQELIVTDVKTVLAMNPLRPVYRSREIDHTAIQPLGWKEFGGGLMCIGWDAETYPDFYFDNEAPIHKEYVQRFRLADRLITNREYKQFIDDGGYSTAALWLSDGWAKLFELGWQAPKYWELDQNGEWLNMTLQGLRPVEDSEPVTHISYYEADAFAAWYGARLATEAEWEVAANRVVGESHDGLIPTVAGNFLDDGQFHPLPLAERAMEVNQLFGDVWEWTRSAYLPYPGYKAAEGALGEYNGKFMSGQMVLRGGSCVTPREHIRPTYRNFFPPESRWQFSGIRLAKDL